MDVASWKDQLPSDHVLLKDPHPWAGCTGEVVAVESTTVGWALRVRLAHQGQDTFVYKPSEVDFI